jgi:DNA-binding HxlR family transcriptional regulator
LIYELRDATDFGYTTTDELRDATECAKITQRAARKTVLNSDYEGQICSIAKTLELIGERWTLLVIRDVFNGNRRFGEMQRSLGVARNVLTNRLQRLVDHGILERRLYRERPARHEYFLTEKGLDLWPTMVAMLEFGDRHLAEDGPPMVLRHKGCGGRINGRGICESCGKVLNARDARAEDGPGMPEELRRAA